MNFWQKQALVMLRKMLIPSLAAFGGYVAGLYPAELAAVCGGVI